MNYLGFVYNKIVISILGGLSLFVLEFKQPKIYGTYIKKFKIHDANSIITLLEKGRFIYCSAVGGCLSEIKGDWELKKNGLIKFKVDSIYTDEYLDKKVEANIKIVEDAFNINKDTFAYKTNLEIAKMRPCFPNLKEALYKKISKTIIFKNNINCTCVPIKGKYKKHDLR